MVVFQRNKDLPSDGENLLQMKRMQERVRNSLRISGQMDQCHCTPDGGAQESLHRVLKLLSRQHSIYAFQMNILVFLRFL